MSFVKFKDTMSDGVVMQSASSISSRQKLVVIDLALEKYYK